MQKITIKNLQEKIPIYPLRIKKAVLNVLKSEGIKISSDITVSFVNDKTIRELNRRFLKNNCSTDVLAFNLNAPVDKKHLIGDLAVSADTAARNSKIYKTSTQHELKLYTIHGTLHLLGYDDHSPKDIKLMRKKECRLIKQKP